MAVAHDWSRMTRAQKTKLVADGIAAGLSAGAISRQTNASRSAILGVAHRAGLTFKWVSLSARTSAPSHKDEEPAPATAAGVGVAMLDLKHSHCRAPLWGRAMHQSAEEYRFCGAKVKNGSAYCAKHHAAFHAPLDYPKMISPPLPDRRDGLHRFFDAQLAAIKA